MTEGFGPVSELERDTVLIEDVTKDAQLAWKRAVDEPLTPRAVDRLAVALHRLNGVDDRLRGLRIEMHNLLRQARAS